MIGTFGEDAATRLWGMWLLLLGGLRAAVSICAGFLVLWFCGVSGFWFYVCDGCTVFHYFVAGEDGEDGDLGGWNCGIEPPGRLATRRVCALPRAPLLLRCEDVRYVRNCGNDK
jgi:hypothetical protein